MWERIEFQRAEAVRELASRLAGSTHIEAGGA